LTGYYLGARTSPGQRVADQRRRERLVMVSADAVPKASSRWPASPARPSSGSSRRSSHRPVLAIQKLLAKTGISIDDVDLIEINEAFAAQMIACMRGLGLDPARVNVNGGALALGHALGNSGARISVTLLHEMRRRDCLRHRLRVHRAGQGIADAVRTGAA